MDHKSDKAEGGQQAAAHVKSGSGQDPSAVVPPEKARAQPRPKAQREEPSSALARVDPLTRYLNEIGRHKLLTREEEHSLAVKYHDDGDLDAAYTLVTANLRLVVKIANEYRRAAFNLLDLIQEGNVGLMLAVKKFDPYKGVKLSTYSAWWIRAYIIRYVMDNWRMVKLGTTQAQRKLFFNLRKEKRRLENMGFTPEAKMLAARLDVTEREVVEMEQRMGASEPSLDTPLGDEDDSPTLGDRLTLGGDAADEVLADAELREIFHEKLMEFASKLEDEREQILFRDRLIAENPKTLQDIGEGFGVSRERARQLEARLIGKMRDYMESEIADFGHLVVEDRS